jgi:hypothetical protein
MHVHKWGRWVTDTEERYNGIGMVIRVKYWQKRECEKCGKLKIRKAGDTL